MSTKITTTVNEHIYDHVVEWKIENLIQSKRLVTPVFSPLPHSDIKFYLEIRYESGVEFNLVKVNGSKNVPSLKMKVQLTVDNMDGSSFKKYSISAPILLSEFTTKTFQDKIAVNKVEPSRAYRPLNLVVNCQFQLFGFFYIRPIASRESTPKELEDKPSILGDINFKVDGRNFSAHRAVIKSSSSDKAEKFLRDLIQNELEQSFWFPALPNIVLSCTAVECFLNFLYTGVVDNRTWDIVVSLYALEHLYKDEILKTECIKIIVTLLNMVNICEIFKLAHHFHDEYLIKEAYKFAIAHMDELVEKEEWKQLVLRFPIIGYDLMKLLLKENKN